MRVRGVVAEDVLDAHLDRDDRDHAWLWEIRVLPFPGKLFRLKTKAAALAAARAISRTGKTVEVANDYKIDAGPAGYFAVVQGGQVSRE